MRKVVFLTISFALVLFLSWRLYQGYVSKPEERAMRVAHAVAVKVADVRTMTVRDIRTFTGSLRANSMFIVAPKVGGRLSKVAVHIGEAVHSGQVVARLEADEYQQQVAEARAELDVAKARISQCRTTLKLAEMEFNRVEELRRKKISSAAEFDQVESELKTVQSELLVLQAQAAQKEAALEAARIRLGYTVMKARWEDRTDVRYVGERFVDEGQMLSANTQILSIVDIKTLKAIVNVIERDYPFLREGQAATITTDAYPGEQFAGTVQRISNVLKEATRQAEVEINVPNPELKLKPGMFVRVRIEFAMHPDATAVPSAAIIQYQGKTGVYLLSADEKSVSFIPLEIGIEGKEWIEVISPAISGRVVTLGHHLLKDGAAVIVPGGAAEKNASGSGHSEAARKE